MLTPDLVCVRCGMPQDRDAVICCCGGLLEVRFGGTPPEGLTSVFDRRRALRNEPLASGVWRFHEIVAPDIPATALIGGAEGNTPVYESPELSAFVGVERFSLKHEGENPTGSFKDRGMAVGISEARRCGARVVACASTGNTSASMAAYARKAGLTPVVFMPRGKVAGGKLAQTRGYGAVLLEVEGGFDEAMGLVLEAARDLGIYLLNSVNPWRIEGQKTIFFELLHDAGWRPPDWIVLPAGNLGNTSAAGKALEEAFRFGYIDRLPRVAAVQAEGASPFARHFLAGSPGDLQPEPHPETLATAIRIGNPRSWQKAMAVIRATRGTVVAVSDREILDAKARIDAAGIGCEPASAATAAGVRRLVEAGIVHQGEHVVAILTGHILKDPEATVAYHDGTLPGQNLAFARPIRKLEPTVEALRAILSEIGD